MSGLLSLEQGRTEALLLNVLPKEIAPILKDQGGTIADHFESASILFADVVGFTPLSAEMTPEEMVKLLNWITSTDVQPGKEGESRFEWASIQAQSWPE